MPSVHPVPFGSDPFSLVSNGRAIRDGVQSCRSLAETLLERIDRDNPRLHAFTVVRKTVVAAADRADQELAAGRWRGPLHGLLIGVKDNIDYAGLATAGGMPVRADLVANTSATAVVRLEDAGAIIVGKLGMAEGASMMHHPALPAPVNPWGDAVWPGVSSSGAAVAVSAGLCLAALGTDTGGSIRMPAAACGITGLMPTWGRVSRHGVLALSESFDHVGPLARSAEDAALLLGVIAGWDALDPTTLAAAVPDYTASLQEGIVGLRLGYDRHAVRGADHQTLEVLEQTLAQVSRLGATLQGVVTPRPDAIGEAAPLVRKQIARVHGAALAAHPELFSRHFTDVIESGLRVTSDQLAAAVVARERYAGQMHAMMSEVDCMISPTMPCLPPLLSDIDAMGGDIDALLTQLTPFTFPANMAKLPAISFPAGLSGDRRPISMQLIGHPLSKAKLLAVVHAFQNATTHHRLAAHATWSR